MGGVRAGAKDQVVVAVAVEVHVGHEVGAHVVGAARREGHVVVVQVQVTGDGAEEDADLAVVVAGRADEDVLLAVPAQVVAALHLALADVVVARLPADGGDGGLVHLVLAGVRAVDQVGLAGVGGVGVGLACPHQQLENAVAGPVSGQPRAAAQAVVALVSVEREGGQGGDLQRAHGSMDQVGGAGLVAVGAHPRRADQDVVVAVTVHVTDGQPVAHVVPARVGLDGVAVAQGAPVGEGAVEHPDRAAAGAVGAGPGRPHDEVLGAVTVDVTDAQAVREEVAAVTGDEQVGVLLGPVLGGPLALLEGVLLVAVTVVDDAVVAGLRGAGEAQGVVVVAVLAHLDPGAGVLALGDHGVGVAVAVVVRVLVEGGHRGALGAAVLVVRDAVAVLVGVGVVTDLRVRGADGGVAVVAVGVVQHQVGGGLAGLHAGVRGVSEAVAVRVEVPGLLGLGLDLVVLVVDQTVAVVVYAVADLDGLGPGVGVQIVAVAVDLDEAVRGLAGDLAGRGGADPVAVGVQEEGDLVRGVLVGVAIAVVVDAVADLDAVGVCVSVVVVAVAVELGEAVPVVVEFVVGGAREGGKEEEHGSSWAGFGFLRRLGGSSRQNRSRNQSRGTSVSSSSTCSGSPSSSKMSSGSCRLWGVG